MSTETWRPVVGFEGLYEVSSQGRVHSVRRPQSKGPHRMVGGRQLRLTATGRGYVQVNLCDAEGVHRREVHILVAAAFIGPRPDGAQIRHLDGNGLNNEVSNLMYGTPSENLADAVRHGTHAWASRSTCSRGHPYTPENTRRDPARPRTRLCRTCRRDRDRQARLTKDFTAEEIRP